MNVKQQMHPICTSPTVCTKSHKKKSKVSHLSGLGIPGLDV